MLPSLFPSPFLPYLPSHQKEAKALLITRSDNLRSVLAGSWGVAGRSPWVDSEVGTPGRTVNIVPPA